MKKFFGFLALAVFTAFVLTTAQAAVKPERKKASSWGQIKFESVKSPNKASENVPAAPRFSGSEVIGELRTPRGGKFYIVAEKYTPSWWAFGEKPRIEVWARVMPYACSLKDKHLLTVEGASDVNKVKNAFCEIKKVYDAGKIVLNCGAAIACRTCMATGCGGNPAVCGVCITACAYTAGSGGRDCITDVIKRVTGVPYIDPQASLGDYGDFIIDQFICGK